MKLSQTLKAVALSGALLAQPGCGADADMCEINSTVQNGAVLENLAEVKEYCHYYRDAVLTCVEDARGCPVSNAYTTSCDAIESNQIIINAETINDRNGSYDFTCVEGNGYIPTK